MGQTEFYPLLNKIKALHADVLCGSGMAEPAVHRLRETGG